MSVTQEILRNHEIYGASDNTNPAGLSSSKALNFANGASIQRPLVERVTRIPYTLNFKDSVGLFGVENCFVRVDVDVIDQELIGADSVLDDDGYLSVLWDLTDQPVLDTYVQAETEGWPFPPNTPEGDARVSGDLARYIKPYVSVNLRNLKTGNKYIDSWLDIRLYTDKREEHPYDLMYVPEKSFFYIGFHARNTRRLPYNVKCTVGDLYLPLERLTGDQSRFIMR